MMNYRRKFRLFLQIFNQAFMQAKLTITTSLTQVYQSHILMQQVMVQQYPSQSSKMAQYSNLSLLKKTFPTHHESPIWTASTISKAHKHQGTRAIHTRHHYHASHQHNHSLSTNYCRQTISVKQSRRIATIGD